MADSIVGMMFAKNEADILPLTITEAMKQVDSLFIADDGSTDGSWEIIQYYKQQYPNKVEYIQQAPVIGDQGQRNALLGHIRTRYKAENTWVQTIESDIVLHTHDLKAVIAKTNREDVSVNWHCMNAIRPYWEGVHQFYPNWPESIRTIMPRFHWTEEFACYTYRPLPELFYSPIWRPWPNGFSHYHTSNYKSTRRNKMKTAHVPMALHYGYRGPSHMMAKWNRMKIKPQNPNPKHGYDYTSLETLSATFTCFNGHYNRSPNTGGTPEEAWEKRG